MTHATVIVVAAPSSVSNMINTFKALHQEDISYASRNSVQFRDGTLVMVVTPHKLESHMCGVTINELLISYDIEPKEQEAVLFELAYRLAPSVKEVQYF